MLIVLFLVSHFNFLFVPCGGLSVLLHVKFTLSYRIVSYDSLPTKVVTHQLQVERRTGKVRRSKTNVLPLYHATNSSTCICFTVIESFDVDVQRYHDLEIGVIVIQITQGH